MKMLFNTIKTEGLKLKRSRIVWITIILFAFIPCMIAGLMMVAQNQELVAKLGIIGTKANLLSTSDWKSYSNLMLQMIAVLGLIGFSFITSWVFGREFIDRTMKDLLALPIKRSTLLSAKFIIVLGWSLLLATILLITCILMAMVIGIQVFTTQLIVHFAIKFYITVLLTVLLMPITAWITCYSQGIIAPLGFIILTLILAQLLSIAGLGFVFPWAIPGLYTIPAGTPGVQLYPVSFVILFITGILGYGMTYFWWYNADHK